jgi:hypothetical protein
MHNNFKENDRVKLTRDINNGDYSRFWPKGSLGVVTASSDNDTAFVMMKMDIDGFEMTLNAYKDIELLS